MSENKNQPKHTLAIIALILGIIAIFTLIITVSGADNMNTDTNGSVLFGLSMYSSVASIVCSVIAKKAKNTEIYPTIGLALGIISIIVIIFFIAANS